MSATAVLLAARLAAAPEGEPVPVAPEVVVDADAETPAESPAQAPVEDPASAPQSDVPEPVTASQAAAPVPEPAPVDRWSQGKRDSKRTPPSEAAIARQSTVPPRSEGRRRFAKARPGSKQRFAAEIKLGPYLPEVDSRYDGPGFGPYATIFGRTNAKGETIKKPKPGVMPLLGFEYQFLYLGGPLAVGTQLGFFLDRADALLANPKPGENLRTKADKIKFGMVPISALLIYRFELAADFFRVPLVPYAKAGLTYAFWWIKDGSGHIARNTQGDKGSGGQIGWQINPGVMLRLDFIERNTAKKLDQGTGINHTYVFGEFQLTRLRNFGVGDFIDLGDKTFFAGFAIEF
ncbi:MAG: hypothetical protein K1X88_22945 [Nannocystaceae bacterium]|nr:hypothetical protein [Nannocystaceae bacterium]